MPSQDINSVSSLSTSTSLPVSLDLSLVTSIRGLIDASCACVCFPDQDALTDSLFSPSSSHAQGVSLLCRAAHVPAPRSLTQHTHTDDSQKTTAAYVAALLFCCFLVDARVTLDCRDRDSCLRFFSFLSPLDSVSAVHFEGRFSVSLSSTFLSSLDR